MGKSDTAEEKDGRKSKAKLDSSLQEPKKKKKKAVREVEDADNETERVSKGRPFTVTVAIPGSIIQNKQSPQLAASLAGQIARTMSIFRVDEVVVFNCPGTDEETKSSESGGPFLARVLQYLETPQYLRRALIPMHPDYRLAGLLPPLDAPHHPRAHEWLPYREGVVVAGEAGNPESKSPFVNVGLAKPVRTSHTLRVGTRVTVRMGAEEPENLESSKFPLVPPTEPQNTGGFYWGYRVRAADSISKVFTECPHKSGYDYSIGTSERGEVVINAAALDTPKFSHLLIMFGGLNGLEEAVDLDPDLEVKDPSCLFDMYINTCPIQGSRTIRCEEAVLITLAVLQPMLDPLS